MTVVVLAFGAVVVIVMLWWIFEEALYDSWLKHRHKEEK